MTRSRIFAALAAIGAFLWGTSAAVTASAPAPVPEPLPDAPEPEPGGWWLQDLIPAEDLPAAGYVAPDTEAANIAAASMMVAKAEGTAAGPNGGYNVLFGWPAPGRTFDANSAVSDHPKIFFPYTDESGKKLKTSAAGKHQVTATTYDDFRARGKVQAGFTPAHQEAFFVAILANDGALAHVKAGRMAQAIAIMRGRWASLPGANVNQPMRSMDYVLSQYIGAGGKLA